MFAQVVFPLPFRNEFTYIVPEDLADEVRMGVRVVVPFGKRILTGYVVSTSQTTDVKEELKEVEDVLDERPLFDEKKLEFFRWVAEYYLSSLGEAIKNSVPYGSDVESKRKVIADSERCRELAESEKREGKRKQVLDILSEKDTYKISTLQKKTGKNLYSVLNTLEKQGALTVVNEIETAKVKAKTVKYVKLARPAEEIYDAMPELENRAPKQLMILLEVVSSKEKEFPQAELLKRTDSAASSITSLEEKGLLETYEKEVDRSYTELYSETFKKFKLTPEQEQVGGEVLASLEKNEFNAFLLHGVTGSGKTQVYIEITREVLNRGKNVLLLVPEISLTPQITSRFFNAFGEKVAVIHSRMSLGERYDTWRNIGKGKYNVVIGPRSALFAPVNNLGFIVVDEEHDSSYKNFETIPRYQARDAAIMLAYFNEAPVLLGSATPSVESMYNAEKGKYRLLEMKSRIDDAKLPKVTLVDINVEKKKKKMENIFSQALLEKIGERLRKKEGIIILQNRRGFATNIYCEDCGEIEMCPNCSVSMVYHINKNIVQCHYCGFIKKTPKACSNCGSLSLKYFGTGTQRVEDELEFYFPGVKMERIDSDSINRRGKLSMLLNSFRKGETDILVGTQMVSKGLDFSHVTLVGVISAETTLWLPDFRADEKTFQLLTQVSGRSGRSKAPGEVIIQTHNKEHFVLQKVIENDYSDFYNKELAIRKKSGYPPFTRLCLIEAKHKHEQDARNSLISFFNILKKYGRGIELHPPAPAIIEKIKGFYRHQILVKSYRDTDPSGKLLRTALNEALIEYNRESRYKNIRLIIDIDPQSVM